MHDPDTTRPLVIPDSRVEARYQNLTAEAWRFVAALAAAAGVQNRG